MPGQDAKPAGPRVLVIGITGSGKSTFAAEIAERADVPFVELDALFWKPNWVESETEEFRAAVDEATSGEAWSVAGNYYTKLADTLWQRADTIVWLDLPYRVAFGRLWRRTYRRWRQHEHIWGSNYESYWRHFLTPDSLFLWQLRSRGRIRRRYETAWRDPQWATTQLVRLRSSNAADRWLDTHYPRSQSESGGGSWPTR